MSKKKTNPKKKAVKKADDWMSKYIRARDRRCITCRSTANLTNSHLITRAKHSVRWHEPNCYCQCHGCNLRHEYQPEIYTDWWILKHGEAAYHELVLKSNTPSRFKAYDIEEIAEEYKNKYLTIIDKYDD